MPEAATFRITTVMPDGPLLLESPPSPLRAWLTLVSLGIRRQARVRQMVWIALGLMAATALFVGLNTSMGQWSLLERRARPHRMSYEEHLLHLRATQGFLRPEPAAAVHLAVLGATRAALDHSAFLVFSRWIIFAVFQSFLLPLWTLAFATDAIGGEREGRTLIWLFTRPLPRWSIYLAKYFSALPWCLGMNLLGFAVICLSAGEPGMLALRLFWPAVLAGTFAFAALFHLIAALFRRPAIIGLLYSFFFETLVSDLPGDLKRMSLSFYIRSIMFDATSALELAPDSLTVYSPVDGATAWGVLAGVTIVLTLIGMWFFSRGEYTEDV